MLSQAISAAENYPDWTFRQTEYGWVLLEIPANRTVSGTGTTARAVICQLIAREARRVSIRDDAQVSR